MLRIALAFSYFLDNEDQLAWQQLDNVLGKFSSPHPFAYWLVGLLNWKKNDYSEAGHFFEKTLDEAKENSLKARASFWAARSYVRSGNYDKVGDLLENASQYPRR